MVRRGPTEPTPAQRCGREAEDRAAEYLRAQGMVLEARNFRCRFGEIDLVMRDGTTIVFVEVRLRRRSRFGTGAETIDYYKQRRLVMTAGCYLQRHGQTDRFPARFDVVTMADPGADASAIEWIMDAFEA